MYIAVHMYRLYTPITLILSLFAAGASAQSLTDGLDYEADGINDYASNETRAACITYFAPALMAAGYIQSREEIDISDGNLMINAHTGRAAGLNCFITYDNELYFFFIDWAEQKKSSMVAKYSPIGFKLFDRDSLRTGDSP